MIAALQKQNAELLMALRALLADADRADLQVLVQSGASIMDMRVLSRIRAVIATAAQSAPASAPEADDDQAQDAYYYRHLTMCAQGQGFDGIASALNELARLRTAAANADAVAVSPTGEQLYTMVVKRFKSGSLPWSIVTDSGKEAWSRAAADLVFAPDTIMAANAPRPAAEKAGGQPTITAEALLRSVFKRPDLSAHGREQFFTDFMEGRDELTLCWGDFRMMAATARRTAADAAHLPGWERGIATVTMNGHQLREALDFINPGGDDEPDERDNDLTFGIVQHEGDDGKPTTGLCCWNGDTDGVLPLDSAPDRVSTQQAAEKDCAA